VNASRKVTLEPALLVRGLVVIAIGLVVASLVLQVWSHLPPAGKSHGVVQMFNLDAETNLPTYFASLLLALATLLSSVDEALELHERLSVHCGMPRVS
jgi:hypothetical protein